MTSTTQWIEDPVEFAALAEEWDAILGPDARPFDLHCWQAAWWNAFGGSDRLAVATVRREGRLVGVFPLRRGRGGPMRGLVNGHSTSCRPLAVDEEAMEVLVGMVASGAGVGLELRGLPIGDPGVIALLRRVAASRMRTIGEPAFASPYIEIDGEWEEWRKANKKRWKAPLEQKRRKMEREYEAEIKPMDEVHDLDPELAEGLRLEAGGWKGEGGTAINSAADTVSFYRDVARDFERRGELRFSWIRLDGTAVAFDFCIVFGNRLWTLKSAYDEEYRKLAPGLVRQLAEIERCFETGIEVLELLGEEVGWKTRFASGNHQHLNLYAFRTGPVGLARLAYRKRLRPALRKAYRRAKDARSR